MTLPKEFKSKNFSVTFPLNLFLEMESDRGKLPRAIYLQSIYENKDLHLKLPNHLLKKIEQLRGNTPRLLFIQQSLEKYLSSFNLIK